MESFFFSKLLILLAAIALFGGIANAVDTGSSSGGSGSGSGSSGSSSGYQADYGGEASVGSRLVLPITVSATARHHTFDADTTLTDALVLRSGDTVELRNGARLSFGPGGYLDTQGTPTDTWSVDADGAITKNLVRDVRVYGSGDIMFMAGSLPSTITWTEFDLQPIQAVDHYPLHWHKAGTTPAGTIVEGVVVKNSTNRCIVPHGVDGITITDTICDNTIGDAVWWNNPTPPASWTPVQKRSWVKDNSNDIVLDHVLVDGVSLMPDEKKYRNFGFQLQCGHGNEIRNSWANNVTGTSHSGGYYWSSRCNLNGGGAEWVFENNGTSNSHACASTWQNGTGPHLMDGLTCHNTNVVGYGAYNMTTRWLGVESNGARHEIKSVGTTIEDSELGAVAFMSAAKYGAVIIKGSTIERLQFNQATTKAGKGHAVRITDSGVTCDDWSGTPAAATSLTIDGEVCF